MATYSKPYQIGRHSWGITETGRDGYSTIVHLTGPSDKSYSERFQSDSSKCSWCYLGYAHSADAHNAEGGK